ncbi:hypothetical protein [Marinomonas sp. FW-1]|uniref:DUF7668 domain-containing protein n=1 Tax=Marinomonas sp. FW-1 TaxID=2071621 RepID=UPI001C3052EE|nr:hypothetical protein [Marinomonas sp. FW-1]
MTNTVPVLKDEDNQTPVPTVWRNTFRLIAEALKEGDFKLNLRVSDARSISAKDAAIITANIRDYGDQLIDLPDDTWSTSVCQWMLDYWEVYIDLFTANEGASDLVLAVRVYEDGTSYIYEVQSVHVP